MQYLLRVLQSIRWSDKLDHCERHLESLQSRRLRTHPPVRKLLQSSPNPAWPIMSAIIAANIRGLPRSVRGQAHDAPVAREACRPTSAGAVNGLRRFVATVAVTYRLSA